MEKNIAFSFSPGAHGQNLDCTSKIQYIQGHLSSAPETLVPCAFPTLEMHCHSHLGVCGRNSECPCTSKDFSQTNLLGQMGLPGPFLPWVTSDLHLKYWASMLSFLWKLAVIPIQEPMLEI